MPPLTLPRGRPAPPTALSQAPLKPLPLVLGKAVSPPPGPGVRGRRVSPHVPVGRATCPLLWAAVLGAAQPCGVSLTTGGIAPASLRYDRLGPVARVAVPCCLAADPLLGCMPARLSLVVAMAPADVWHGPRCSPAGLRPVALEYRSCHWLGWLGGSPQCVRPGGCGWLCPVPLLPSVRVRVRCPGPLCACSPVRTPCVFRARCPWPLGACCRCARCVRHVCVVGGFIGDPFFSHFCPCFFVLLFGALVLLCLLFVFFLMLFCVCLSPPFFSEKIQ